MANINQTIIIRTDLFKLPDDLGLISAQIAHIHMQLVRRNITSRIIKDPVQGEQVFIPDNVFDNYFVEWIKEPYILVKKVPNLEALMHYSFLAREAKLLVDEWEDTVYIRLSETQKIAKQTLVGISLGPCDADKIRSIVGDLPLL
jgi:peptidyl-tRNA hydrolase